MNDYIDNLVKEEESKRPPKDRNEMVADIHPDIYFKYNSVNLVVGGRGSGKTYTTLREILKLPLYFPDGENKYTQIHYITDKEYDDTVEKFVPLFEKHHIFFNWVPTENAEEVITGITTVKKMMTYQEFRENEPDNYQLSKECLNYDGNELPHTIIIFDDCMGLFSKDTSLSKRLFENRQARITYFLLLQDGNGVNSKMKSNINTLVLFGGFSKQRLNVLFYQLPPNDFNYDAYTRMRANDAIIIDLGDGSVRPLNNAYNNSVSFSYLSENDEYY